MFRSDVLVVLTTGLVLSFVAHSADQLSFDLQCGSLVNLENPYGPFDYTDPSDFTLRLPVVEQYHFTGDVENLVSGISGTIGSEIDYTLRAFPNHHRALDAMARLELRDGVEATIKPASCYFERAIRFRPDDAVVYMVYGIYLYRLGQIDTSLANLEKSVNLAPEAAESHYNLGLVQFEAGRFKNAAESAAKALEFGYPLQGLIRKLDRNGHWPPNKGNVETIDSAQSSNGV